MKERWDLSPPFSLSSNFRLFLAAVSPVFQKTFYGSLGEETEINFINVYSGYYITGIAGKIIKINDSSSTAFKMFLGIVCTCYFLKPTSPACLRFFLPIWSNHFKIIWLYLFEEYFKYEVAMMFLEYIYCGVDKITVLEHHNLDSVENITTLFQLLKLADM